MRCPECTNKTFSEFVQGIAFWTEEKDEEIRTKLQQHGYSKGHTTTNWKHINKMKTECWSADWNIQYASHEPKFLMQLKTHADDDSHAPLPVDPGTSSGASHEEQATRQILFRILNNQMKANFELMKLSEKINDLSDKVEDLRGTIGTVREQVRDAIRPTAPPPTRLAPGSAARARSRSPLLTPKTESGV